MSAHFQSGKYDISGEVAKGGMGAILSARDNAIGRTVAMKVLLDGSQSTHQDRLRFQREAQILGQLEHPNIVPMHELGTDAEGQPYYTMKFVQGRNFKDVLKAIKDGDEETLTQYQLNQLLTVFQKICDAMAYAHSKGVIHRDLKPENVMLGQFGEVLVMDWGLAKVLGEKAEDGKRKAESAGSETSVPGGLPEQRGDGIHAEAPDLTLDGHVMGTPQFMAPEQADGRVSDQDERTDIFALGGMLYNILSLRSPTSGKTTNEILENIRTGYIAPPIIYNKARTRAASGAELEAPIEMLHCPGGQIPEALSAVAMKAMALDATQRYPTVQALQTEITQFQGGFATAAEGAGAFRQMSLLVRRHKAQFVLAVVALMLMGALATVFTYKLVQFQQEASGTLTDLKKTIPLQRAEIAELIDAQDFDSALAKISELLRLDAKNVEWHLLKGNLLQTKLQLAAARDCYRVVLQLDSQNTRARENVQLCEELISAQKSQVLPPAKELAKLQMAMLAQQRQPESLVIARLVGKVSHEKRDYWRETLTKAGVRGELELDADGALSLDLKDQQIPDLAMLKGVPLNRLNLGGNSLVPNLEPLRGMPLRDFDVRVSKISDFGPLKGMALTNLSYHFNGAPGAAGVSNLSALAGMPLRTILFYGIFGTDLSPLKGAPLESLSIYGCQNLSDLSPLRGLPLRSLALYHSQISDLTPLAGMPLRSLELGQSQISNLAALRGMPLVSLRLEENPVKDISQVKDLPLSDLILSRTAVTNLAPLAGHPFLANLFLDGCTNVIDLNPLVECTNLQLVLLPPRARNVELLRDHPMIKRISYTVPDNNLANIPTAAEFWKVYDARKGKKK